MTRNLYEVLGVDAGASPEQIQAAYAHWSRQLASRNLPSGSEELKALQDAYSVLARPERRRAYDASAGGRSGQAEPLRDPLRERLPKPQAKHEFSIAEGPAAQPSFDELFERLWSNFSNLSRPKAEGVESLVVEIVLTPEEARKGGTARVMIPARAACPACSGHGSLGLYECWHCGGHGSITADHPVDLVYPPGVLQEHLVQVPLNQFGIDNFYLTVRFRLGNAS